MRFITILATSLLLSACQLSTHKPTDSSQPILSNQSLKQWQTEGKAAIRTQEDSQVIRYHWQQDNDNYSLTLSGAFGLGTVTIKAQNGDISLHKGKKILDKASSAEQLLLQQTGLTLPISFLKHWAIGLPAPNTEFQFTPTLPQPAGIHNFSQANWLVQYLKIERVDRQLLPQKILLTQADKRIILTLKNWRLTHAD